MKLGKLLNSQFCAAAIVCASALVPVAVFADDDTDNIKVMTRNLYLGADIFPVLDAAQDPNPIAVPLAVTEIYQSVLATNFHERAEALADEIARRKPHVVGLQEVSIWRTQFPGDFLAGNPQQAEDVMLDFLDILQAAIEARGLSYDVAVSVDNADIEVPLVLGFDPTTGAPTFGDLRLTDRDVTLVRNKKNVSYSNPYAANFTVNGAVDVAGASLEFTRGYNLLDVNVKGTDYRIVNTHLEVGGSEPFKSLQAVQMNELMHIIAATSNDVDPVIMLGDFNSAPEDLPFNSASGIPGLDGLPLVPPYLQIVNQGFDDLWLERKRPAPGLTCCFDALVADEDAELTSRIDHIFIDTNGRTLEKAKVKVVGDSNADMTDASNLYPSDHAGVFGKIKLQELDD